MKQVIKDWGVCKKAQIWPLRGSEPPDLPSYRLSNSYAFSNTGTSFAGPLYVKNIYGDSGLLFKCYICLFTCATPRNELTPFVSGRWGKINLFITDNVQTFASDELKNFLSFSDINWKYIQPLSPWWGRFYERLIRIVKSALQKVLGKSRLNYEELSAIITEVEGIINTRTSTDLYDDDDVTAITPSYLIIGWHLLENMNMSNIDDFDMTKDECTKTTLFENDNWTFYVNTKHITEENPICSINSS